MIIFNIIQDNEDLAEEMAFYLIENNYAVQTHVDVNTLISAKEKTKTIRLFFITKALLYDEIEKGVKQRFYHEKMLIYAEPVSHINEEFGEILRRRIKAI